MTVSRVLFRPPRSAKEMPSVASASPAPWECFAFFDEGACSQVEHRFPAAAAGRLPSRGPPAAAPFPSGRPLGPVARHPARSGRPGTPFPFQGPVSPEGRSAPLPAHPPAEVRAAATGKISGTLLPFLSCFSCPRPSPALPTLLLPFPAPALLPEKRGCIPYKQ